MSEQFDIIIIGGGAAGFFSAINIAEKNPNFKIAVLERGKEVLSKVRISGGGRCNLAHACFDPNELVNFYPRGNRELKSSFNKFCSGDTIEWFKKQGILLNTEKDGRIFPASNSSQTIIDCFVDAAIRLKIKIVKEQCVHYIYKSDIFWKIGTQNKVYKSDRIVLASGSNPRMWEIIKKLGHTIVDPVPSLFTFNITDKRIKDLSGISVVVSIQIKDTKLVTTGPLLITHWGVSGPVVLKLSAWGARILADKNYQFIIFINWLNNLDKNTVEIKLKEIKLEQGKIIVNKKSPFDIPNRLWKSIVLTSGILPQTKWADVKRLQIQNLANELTKAQYNINGKSTFKEEFVTAGGVNLKEINFKTMQSNLHDTLYFAGEVINVDAITGGFNFQNAWTSGFIVSQSIV